MPTASPFGLHRVRDDKAHVLPQQAWRLDARGELLSDDEVRIDVHALHLDAASYRQLAGTHTIRGGGPGGVEAQVDGEALRAEVLDIIAERGKMQNPITGSGGMLIGRVAQVGPTSPLGLRVGQDVATLVSLALTPLTITDGLRGWDGLSEQAPAQGHAILFGRSIAAVLPEDLAPELSLLVMDVCGAPALVSRVVTSYVQRHPDRAPRVCVLGGAGKSGVLSLAAAGRAGAGERVAVVRDQREADLLTGYTLISHTMHDHTIDSYDTDSYDIAEHVVIADATNPVEVAHVVADTGSSADITVVCVDVPGCEQPAIMATADGGTVIFFSMATQFAAAALGAEGLAADVTMLVGNGYTPGHADLAVGLLRTTPAVRAVFESRLGVATHITEQTKAP
ncbi:L-erythro-3,5-diaminohexanoate dehydrogenase [soil metagenome]